jgi:uncharacterized protein YfiM (DUF2279 family)
MANRKLAGQKRDAISTSFVVTQGFRPNTTTGLKRIQTTSDHSWLEINKLTSWSADFFISRLETSGNSWPQLAEQLTAGLFTTWLATSQMTSWQLTYLPAVELIKLNLFVSAPAPKDFNSRGHSLAEKLIICLTVFTMLTI